MAKKFSVYITVPECNEKFNFLIPETLKISVMQRLVVDILCKENKLSEKQTNNCLINLFTGKILNENKKVEESEIFDGTELLLIKR